MLTFGIILPNKSKGPISKYLIASKKPDIKPRVASKGATTAPNKKPIITPFLYFSTKGFILFIITISLTDLLNMVFDNI